MGVNVLEVCVMAIVSLGFFAIFVVVLSAVCPCCWNWPRPEQQPLLAAAQSNAQPIVAEVPSTSTSAGQEHATASEDEVVVNVKTLYIARSAVEQRTRRRPFVNGPSTEAETAFLVSGYRCVGLDIDAPVFFRQPPAPPLP